MKDVGGIEPCLRREPRRNGACQICGMRIHVAGASDVVTGQMRAYAEYRTFAELAKFGRQVRGASVIFERCGANDAPGVTCLVEVDLEAPAAVRCRATERQAAEAIERASRRAGQAVSAALRINSRCS